MNNLLVVEDDSHIRELVLYILQKEGYSVIGVSSAEDALEKCKQQAFDLIILDIQLPGLNGYQFCQHLQREHTHLPLIIMLTDQADVSDIEKGLASYADDYIAKPFNPRILIARITATLRRRTNTNKLENTEEQLAHGGILLSVPFRQVTFNNRQIQLQKMEFDILFLLMSSPNKVYSRDAIISYSKGDNYYIADRAIDNQIYKLRKKLGSAGQYIETVSGIGYRFHVSTNR